MWEATHVVRCEVVASDAWMMRSADKASAHFAWSATSSLWLRKMYFAPPSSCASEVENLNYDPPTACAVMQLLMLLACLSNWHNLAIWAMIRCRIRSTASCHIVLPSERAHLDVLCQFVVESRAVNQHVAAWPGQEIAGGAKALARMVARVIHAFSTGNRQREALSCLLHHPLVLICQVDGMPAGARHLESPAEELCQKLATPLRKACQQTHVGQLMSACAARSLSSSVVGCFTTCK